MITSKNCSCGNPLTLDKNTAKVSDIGYWSTCSCGSTALFPFPESQEEHVREEYSTKTIKLPDGSEIEVKVFRSQADVYIGNWRERKEAVPTFLFTQSLICES